LQAHSEVGQKRQCFTGGAFSGTAKVRRGALRAFGKALKVTARLAADAGVMQIQLSEGWVWRRS